MTEVVTGEAVVLEVPCARFPSRLLALGIDVVIQGVLLLIFLWISSAAASSGLDAAATAAVRVTIGVVIAIGYPVAWETLTRGQSPGKFALGIRVVSDDGSPERFRQALVRGLTALVEIWLLEGAPALITSLISARGKRLGDMFAGTFVVQERLPSRHSSAFATVPAQLQAWAAALELSGLKDQTAEMASRYLARISELRPEAQAHLGAQIATAVSAQVAPPPPAGIPAPVYLSAVLAERRRREQARLAATQPGGTPASVATPAPVAPAPARGMPVGGSDAPPTREAGRDEGSPTDAQPAAPPAPRAGGFVPPA